MSSLLRHLLRFLFHLGYFGPLLMGVMDSSFLFLPFGNDLLVVGLTVRNRSGLPFYIGMAALGSTLGVLLLDLLARKGGEEGVKKLMKPSRFEYLKKKISKNGAAGLILGSLAPPPFPFTMVVAATSGLGYPRVRLLSIVFASRAARFTILGLLALHYGRGILRIVNSSGFRWTMIVFIVICLAGSVWSVLKWVRGSRKAPDPAKSPASAGTE